jgi:predicted alpha/beta superfamily hydrolase
MSTHEAAAPPADDSVPGVVGTLHTLGPVRSEHLGNERPIYVLLPTSYATDTDRRYPVLYMHDGQNLFSDALAFGREWQVDEHMERLRPLGLEAIVVGIPNGGADRAAEYSPYVDPDGGGGHGETYLKFVVEEVAPLIQERYRLIGSRDATGMMGSSLGALISLYAYFRYPELFGFVGAMSPAIWFGGGALLGDVERTQYISGRIYLDIGTDEGEEHVQHVHTCTVSS